MTLQLKRKQNRNYRNRNSIHRIENTGIENKIEICLLMLAQIHNEGITDQNLCGAAKRICRGTFIAVLQNQNA